VDADLATLGRRKAVQYGVVQVDERPQQSGRGVKLQRKARFGEVNLDANGLRIETLTNVAFRFIKQMVQELFARIVFPAAG
jgi:hypothetical protein